MRYERLLRSRPVNSLRKSFRQLLLLAASVLLIAATLLSLRTDRPGSAGVADKKGAEAFDERTQRGKYLAVAGNCASCHTTANGGFMAGGVAFDTPFGKIYSTNITPDQETGIGAWTEEQFRNAMRRGIRPNGEHLYPVFPYTAFSRISDEDVGAIYSYLKSITAISKQAPQNDIAFPFNLRSLLSVWKALHFDDGVFEPDASRSATWNRGAYLVEALAHCSACHSPRNLLGAEKPGMAMTGGMYVDTVRGGALRPWSTPNLTSDLSGLGLWPVEEVVQYLKTGINSYVETFGPMNEVILNSTRHLSEEDINAMAVYLKSLPPRTADSGAKAGDRVRGMGRTLYNLHCGTCHLPTGLGDAEMAPTLGGGSLVVRASDPAALINVILYGPELPDPPLPTGRRKPMEEFQYLLDDEEVAALASFVRSEWGNSAGAVTAGQVAAQR